MGAAVLVSLRIEPEPEFPLPIAVPLFGDVHDDGRLLDEFGEFGVSGRVAALCALSGSPNLVFELPVPPNAENVGRVARNLRGALHILDIGNRMGGSAVALARMGHKVDVNALRNRPGHRLENRLFLAFVGFTAHAQPHQAVDGEHVAAVAAAGIFKDLDDPAYDRLADEPENPQPAIEPTDDLTNEVLRRAIDVARLLHHAAKTLPRRHFERGKADPRPLIAHRDERV